MTSGPLAATALEEKQETPLEFARLPCPLLEQLHLLPSARDASDVLITRADEILKTLSHATDQEWASFSLGAFAEKMMDLPSDLSDAGLAKMGGRLLVIAKLIWAKVQKLLPPEPLLEDEEVSPRRMGHLLPTQLYRHIAGEWLTRPWLGRDLYKRSEGARRRDEVGWRKVVSPLERPLAPMDPYQLLSSYGELVQRSKEVPLELVPEKKQTQAQLQLIVDRINQFPSARMEFWRLLPLAYTRRDAVLGFLAALELARLHCVKLEQDGPFATLWIHRQDTIGVQLLEEGMGE